MAGIITASIDVSKLPKEKFFKGKKGVYYEFTISIFDEPNQFNQNVAITDSQTQEEREAKKPTNYLGNGKVVWTNNILNKIENTETPKKETVEAPNDLPF